MLIDILIVDDVEANLISLEALLESIDENYNIIKANSGAEALEVTLKQEIDLVILDIQMPDMDGFEVAQFLKGNKKTKEIPIIFLTAAFKSEEWIEKGFELGAVDYLTKPIDENQFLNRISLYTKLIKSIEENRQKDKILHEQTKMASMGEMIGNIAHQWRQPLSVISTAATGLQLHLEMGLASDDKIIKTCETINDNAQFLSKTIDDFRDFIKGNRSKEQFNIEDRLKSFKNLINPSIVNHQIELQIELNGNKEILGYPNELVQCLMNLYNNSKDALNMIDEKERLIFVKVFVDKKNISISFKDNAQGIQEEYIDKIFDAYFTTKHPSQGTGLGLYMTYNLIVNGMEGSISVKNIDFLHNIKTYKGTEFIITIPIN